MTAKDELRRAIEGLTEDEAAALLDVVSQRAQLDSETATRILDGIPGAFESAQRGRQQAREGRAISLDELIRDRGLS
jgi:hypothetical protein